ncbi:MAG TPA: fumarylacetoacetate hydrolase family protein [Acidimicrobiales bacterium]|jgi:2-keto-4-pentenoate hydratase/2-oxohepta-3-ene-1,7-dioic acid hydratase in catechol pathway|nr:fumarylacetoacetate hydrolase family protein [Acidimicrobiales bacterium]
MRYVTFETTDGHHLGVVDGDAIADVTGAVGGLGPDLGAVLAAGRLADVVAVAANAPRVALSDVTLASPVLRPPKFLAIGLNYAKHVAESGMEAPKFQLWFNKQSTCAIGAGAAIHVPKASAVVDYEGELAFVIGRRCRHVPAARASEVIAGYTICNDVSVRDWQARTPTMTMGKSFDTHGPLGPWVVTADELGDPHRLSLRTWVNDELRQDGRTDDLIYDCFDMVEHLSTAFTLEPGDVISTGTPAGVGIAMKPPGLLKAGDVVRIEIEGIGTLENPVIDEPDSTATGLD